MDGSLSDNVCKLYLCENLVIIHSRDFMKKEGVVDYAVNVVRENKKAEFKGAVLNRNIKENAENVKREELKNNDKIDEGLGEDERVLNDIQDNTFFLLNERNKIIFLLSVLNELRSRPNRKGQALIMGQVLKLARSFYQKL